MQSHPAAAAAATAMDESALSSSPLSSPSSSPLMHLPSSHRATRTREAGAIAGSYGAADAPSSAAAAAAPARPRPSLSATLVDLERNFVPLHDWLNQLEDQVRDGAWPLQEEMMVNCRALARKIDDLKNELPFVRSDIANAANECCVEMQSDVQRTTNAFLAKIKTLTSRLNDMWKTNTDNINKIQRQEDYRRSWKLKLATCISQFKSVKSAHGTLNSDIRTWQKSEAVQFNGLLHNVGLLINEHRAIKDKCAYYASQHNKETAENAKHQGHIAQLEDKNKDLTKTLQAQLQDSQMQELKIQAFEDSFAKHYQLTKQFEKQQERLLKIEKDNFELEALLVKNEIMVPETIGKHRPRTLPGASRVQSNRAGVGNPSGYAAAAAPHYAPSSARASSSSAAPARSTGPTAPIDPRRTLAPTSRVSGQKRPAEPIVPSPNKQPTRVSLPTRSPMVPRSPLVREQIPVSHSSAPPGARPSPPILPEINFFSSGRPLQPQPQPQPRQRQQHQAPPSDYWGQTAPSFQPTSDAHLYDYEQQQYVASSQFSVRLDGAQTHTHSMGD